MPNPINVLVTGGAGYIGSHTCKELARNGFHPIAYDNLSRGHRSLVRHGDFEAGDIRDHARLDEVIKRYQPEVALHFAALAYVGESVSDPRRYFENNTAGSIELLSALLRHGVNRIVFSSTCATYGCPTTLPIIETAAQNPVNPYGRSKLMVEQIIHEYSSPHGLKSVILRYFNACGADPDGELGEIHDPEPHLIPRALLVASGRLARLEVFGRDYPTPDGTCIRDYIHVSDLACAHVAAVRYLLSGGESVALNLGTGAGLSVQEIVNGVETITSRRLNVAYGPRRIGDPAALVADASRSREVLGIVPVLSDLETIISTAWAWQQRTLHEADSSHLGTRGRS